MKMTSRNNQTREPQEFNNKNLRLSTPRLGTNAGHMAPVNTHFRDDEDYKSPFPVSVVPACQKNGENIPTADGDKNLRMSTPRLGTNSGHMGPVNTHFRDDEDYKSPFPASVICVETKSGKGLKEISPIVKRPAYQKDGENIPKPDEGFDGYKDYSQISMEDLRDPSAFIYAAASAKDPPFPVKLHRILCNPDFKDIIDWLPHGRSWRVLRPKEFEERVVPFHFRHCRYSSFMRQVNGWGFRRVFQGPDLNSYYHELFLRGMPHLCLRMRRPSVKGTKRDSPDSSRLSPPDFYAMSKKHPLPNGKFSPPKDKSDHKSDDHRPNRTCVSDEPQVQAQTKKYTDDESDNEDDDVPKNEDPHFSEEVAAEKLQHPHFTDSVNLKRGVDVVHSNPSNFLFPHQPPLIYEAQRPPYIRDMAVGIPGISPSYDSMLYANPSPIAHLDHLAVLQVAAARQSLQFQRHGLIHGGFVRGHPQPRGDEVEELRKALLASQVQNQILASTLQKTMRKGGL